MKKFNPVLINCINSAKKLLITSHVHPDGDAAGSVLGLTRSLREAGKIVDIAWSTTVKGRFDFLFRDESVLEPSQVEGPYDCVVILDIGSEDRTGFQDTLRALNCPIINIDHHATNKGFCKIDHVDTDASSTCQIVYYLIKEAGWPMNAFVAEAVYTGLVTDSRHFQNAGVSSDTFKAAAGLKETGVDTVPIIQNLVMNRSETDLRVLGMALGKFENLIDDKLALVTITQADLEPLNANHRHAWSAGIFGYLLSQSNAVVSASLIESEDGKVFCEFRSKNGFDVSGIASGFGGGGHKAASGCSRYVPINEFKQEVIQQIDDLLKDFQA